MANFLTRYRRRMVQSALFAAISGASQIAPAAQAPVNWNGGNGDWTTAANWSTGVVPNNGGGTTYAVNIDGGNAAASNVSMFLTNNTIDSLAIDAGDTLSLDTARLTLLNGLTVNGRLQLRTLSVTLPHDGGIDGTGTVEFRPSTSSSTSFNVASGTMTVGPGITVGGAGSTDLYYYGLAHLGGPSNPLENRGRIAADTSGAHIAIAFSSLDNQGTLEASNGGTLSINSPNWTLASLGNLVVNTGGKMAVNVGTLNNTGQTLTMDQPHAWSLLHGGTISGGTINSVGNGTLYVPFVNTGTLNNITLNGTVDVNGELIFTGTLSGTGTVKISNPEPLQGVGHVRIGTVPPGITIRGGIDVSFDNPSKAMVFATSNQGVIRAQRSILNGNGRLTIAGALTNTGALQISDGGTLIASDLTFGANGKLVVDGGGQLDVMGQLDLNTSFDTLDVYPKTGGGPYVSQIVATYTGALLGTFNSVTSGITVSYATPGQIRISGTPVPEPASIGILLTAGMMLANRRRARRG